MWPPARPARRPRKLPPLTKTFRSARLRPNARDFLQRWIAEGPTHHFALGVGHQAATLKQIGDILSIESVIV